ncbi:SDR family NAD(P)-dependent oxidoreductase [Ahrensia marina]|uniref:3-oxoacyl-ACP reductase n=1 Tax=Ahrensia marina TaxID=1514904 RepID=A0A0N0E839_9HYPH|nr:SDR family oxidoreductase [Ahrensia marina]KPB01912.1 3-oxoacyl-ACP reductase [Ahrensia marina]
MTQFPIFPDLKDASVLITGGGSGIGAALTEGFVAQGAKVSFIDIADKASSKLCASLEEKYGISPLYIKADLADEAAIKDAVNQAVEAHGPITVLVNNAAWDDRHEIADVDAAYWDKNVAINLRHQFFTIQAVVEGMKAAGGGAIVNFTSTSYMLNIGDMPVYTASKGGVVGLTKGLAGKLGPDKIRVNAVAPGWVMTERQKELWATPEGVAANLQRQSLRHELQPVEMAGPCLFLASKSASAVTAQVLIADGGIL